MSFFRSSPPSDYLLCPNLLHLCPIAGWSLSLLRILVFATTCKIGLNSALPEVWVKFASFHLRPVLWNRILSYPGNSRFNPGFSVLQRWITSCWGRWPQMFQVGGQQVWNHHLLMDQPVIVGSMWSLCFSPNEPQLYSLSFAPHIGCKPFFFQNSFIVQ